MWLDLGAALDERRAPHRANFLELTTLYFLWGVHTAAFPRYNFAREEAEHEARSR